MKLFLQGTPNMYSRISRFKFWFDIWNFPKYWIYYPGQIYYPGHSLSLSFLPILKPSPHTNYRIESITPALDLREKCLV